MLHTPLFYIYLLLFILVHPVYILSQYQPFSTEEIDRMTITYTYYIAQKASLESVSERFPQLKDYAVDASSEWIKEFKSSIAKIDSNLWIIKGNDWEKDKSLIYDKYREADHSNVSEKEARKFIDIIFQRSNGKIQSPILETLLSYKPEYEEAPEKEFSDGYINNYVTVNSKKKTGINIRIVYPKSWITLPGDAKNNINQIFVSKVGAGNLTLTFLLERTANLPIEKIAPLLTESSLKKKCLKNDSVINFSSALEIDNCPAATLTFLRKEDNGKKLVLFQSYHSYYKNNHITLLFSFNSKNNDPQHIKMEYEKYRHLIHKIISNVVILSQWEQKRF